MQLESRRQILRIMQENPKIEITAHRHPEFIRSKGGVPGDSVTKKTSCLVCGDKPGSKLQKAKELGITVLLQQSFSVFLSQSKVDG